MPSKISAAFGIDAWDEQPFDQGDGVAKLTKASVAKTYTGDIEGGSATEWLMAYQPDASAVFVGLERIRGTIAGRRGSLVLQHIGHYANGSAKAKLTIVSGTGDLENATGSGEFVADPGGRMDLVLDS